MTIAYGSETALQKTRDARKGLNVESLRESIINHIAFTQGKVPGYATQHDRYVAVAMAVRDRLIDRWIATRKAYYSRPGIKRVYYLSLEFLMGRTLGNSLVNLNLYDECYQALFELGYDLEDIREMEEDAGLGNGGLGRLAACFLDSMATLGLPGYGYGIRYDYGIFHQRIRNGYQVEEPDDWLRLGNPWEIARPERTFRVQFYGRVERESDELGRQRARWVDTHDILAMPYDTPVPGYGNNTVNTLRLFSAKSTNEFELDYFNHGNYVRACEDKIFTENITKVLYPKDDFDKGRELRLKQEYLLVSAALQDILDRFRKQHDDWRCLPDRAAVQLNDTHPALAVPELMRLLMDREGLGWDDAWDITVRTFAYTNHTVMPEALEKWPVSLMENLLPRHAEIIYEINHRFLGGVRRRFPRDDQRVQRMSLIEEGYEQKVRMANLAIVGSHSVNGVSALHTQILKDDVLRDFHELYPDRINNKTNGITPRRWLKKCNAPLAYLIADAIGDKWVTDLDELHRLVPLADDPEFRQRWREVKHVNKQRLAAYVRAQQGVELDPGTLFDVQVKRLHEYKRQLMNILHAITLYNRIKSGAETDPVPRTILFGGKAAPGYYQAKLCTKLATAVGDAVNHDPSVDGRLKVAFLENYRVSLAERIIPAADLSEQISTAGMEASGTGNMKFTLNGALTIGTLDGANIEIREQVGDENIFIFGLTADEVKALRASGYNPRDYYDSVPELRTALDQIADNHFSRQEPGVFQMLIDRLLKQGDPFLNLADFEAYVACQRVVSETYRDADAWTRMSILNTANVGLFSSDRTIRQYADEIWNVAPVPVKLD
ncbi:MAG: glycogen/starch/alpha-glucan phosphorylase [Phycisphaerales bacterium]|nr:MAG: glycogen/starch/alpha-glucan phosphorylase [Phycisphaerales bacterium]